MSVSAPCSAWIAILGMAIQALGSTLDAQESARLSVAAGSRCDVLPWTADSAVVEVHLALGPADLPWRDWSGERQLLSPTQSRRFGAILDAFRARFPVNTLAAPELKRPLDAADLDYIKHLDAGVPSLWNHTVFTLHGDGRVSGLRTDHPSRSPTLDSLIARTLEAIGAEGVLANLQGDTATAASAESDSLRLEMRYYRNDAVAAVPLGPIRVPRYDFKPALAVEGFPRPKYPPDLRDARVQGEVLVQLIVDSAGRPDMKSAVVLRATNFEFARAVFDVLPEFKFHVARINGCPAKQLVQMPFAFRLR